MNFRWVEDAGLSDAPVIQSPLHNVSAYSGIATEQKMFTFHNQGESILLGKMNPTAFGNLSTWFGGPTLQGDRTEKKDCLYFICKSLEEIECIGIKDATPNYNAFEDSREWSEVYSELGFLLERKWATYLVDLRRGIDVLQGNLQSGLRKNIRKLQEKDHSVKDILDPQVFDDYLLIIAEARERGGLSPLDLRGILNKVKHNPWRRYFVLYVEGRPVACQGLIFNNRVATEVVLGISNHAINNKIYAGDLIKWKILEWCVAKGIGWYDLAGVSPIPQNEKEKGIYIYKQKWGGNYIEYPIWAKGLSPRFTLYRTADILRNKLSGLRKLIPRG